MRRFLINIIAVTLPCLLICFILLELVFRFVIPASQLPDTVWCESGGIPHFDTKGKTDGIFTAGRFAQLRAQWHINNDGWISETDYSDTRLPGRRLIAIIGDSYIEALAVGVNKNVSAVLGRLLGSQVDVYSFGYAGSPLSQYLQMSRYVARKYKPDIFVINVVHNDLQKALRSWHHSRTLCSSKDSMVCWKRESRFPTFRIR